MTREKICLPALVSTAAPVCSQLQLAPISKPTQGTLFNPLALTQQARFHQHSTRLSASLASRALTPSRRTTAHQQPRANYTPLCPHPQQAGRGLQCRH